MVFFLIILRLAACPNVWIAYEKNPIYLRRLHVCLLSSWHLWWDTFVTHMWQGMFLGKVACNPALHSCGNTGGRYPVRDSVPCISQFMPYVGRLTGPQPGSQQLQHRRSAEGTQNCPLPPSPAPHFPASKALPSITLPHTERCLLTEVIPVTATN